MPFTILAVFLVDSAGEAFYNLLRRVLAHVTGLLPTSPTAAGDDDGDDETLQNRLVSTNGASC